MGTGWFYYREKVEFLKRIHLWPILSAICSYFTRRFRIWPYMENLEKFHVGFKYLEKSNFFLENHLKKLHCGWIKKKNTEFPKDISWWHFYFGSYSVSVSDMKNIFWLIFEPKMPFLEIFFSPCKVSQFK